MELTGVIGGHKYKLYKKAPGTRIRSKFFSKRVITVWNELPVSTDFSTITRFNGSILNAHLSDYLACFNDVLFCCTSFCILCVVLLYITRGSCKCTECLAVQSHVSVSM